MDWLTWLGGIIGIPSIAAGVLWARRRTRRLADRGELRTSAGSRQDRLFRAVFLKRNDPGSIVGSWSFNRNIKIEMRRARKAGLPSLQAYEVAHAKVSARFDRTPTRRCAEPHLPAGSSGEPSPEIDNR